MDSMKHLFRDKQIGRSWQRFSDDIEAHFNPRLSVPQPDEILKQRRIWSDAARDRMSYDLDIRYGAGPRQLLDLFHPQAPGPGVLVFIHGGYWRGGDKSSVTFVAEPFVAAGIPTFVLNYDLCPSAPVSRIAEEIVEALMWIARHAAEWGYSPRIFLFGHSAGAHLSALALTRNLDGIEILGAVLASGIYDLEPVLHLSMNAEIGLLRSEVDRVSPLLVDPPVGVPMLLTVGADEPAGWRAQTFDYQRHCRNAGCDVRVYDALEQNHMSLLHRHLEIDCPARTFIVDAVMNPQRY